MAYCLDSAVYTFGKALEHELDSAEGKTKDAIKKKRERILNKWLDMPQKFRNPGVVGPGTDDGVEQQFTTRGN